MEKQQLYDLFIIQNMSASKIAEKHGKKTTQIESLLGKYKIRRCSPKSEWYNPDFSILNDAQIYILGYLWADGCVYRGALSFEILEKDFLSIKKTIEMTGNWNFYLRNRGFKNSTVTSVITNKYFYKTLLDFNFFEKSHVSFSKLLNIIPENKHFLFLRGFSDGDGCFYSGKVNQYSISSSYYYDWSVFLSIMDKIGMRGYRLIQEAKGNCNKSLIKVTNRRDILLFGDYLYQNLLDYRLDRKYQKFLEIKNKNIKARGPYKGISKKNYYG